MLLHAYKEIVKQTKSGGSKTAIERKPYFWPVLVRFLILSWVYVSFRRMSHFSYQRSVEYAGCISCRGIRLLAKKLDLIVKVQFWTSGESSLHLRSHYSYFHSVPELQHLLGSHHWTRENRLRIVCI